MNSYLVGGLIGLLLLVVAELVPAAAEQIEAWTRYRRARALADRHGKPLLVVGGPYGLALHRWIRWPAHGSGDVCVDLDPRAANRKSTAAFVRADVQRLPFGDKQFGAAFCSHLLEHLPNAAACLEGWWELHRVADEVVCVFPHRWHPAAVVAPGHKLWVRVDERVRGGLLIEERKGRVGTCRGGITTPSNGLAGRDGSSRSG